MPRRRSVRTRTVVVRSRGRSRRAGFTIPLAVVAGMVPGIMEGKRYFDVAYPRSQAIPNFFKGLAAAYTGYDADSQSWSLTRMKTGALPLLAGVLVHRVANKLGVNRALSGIPFVRI